MPARTRLVIVLCVLALAVPPLSRTADAGANSGANMTTSASNAALPAARGNLGTTTLCNPVKDEGAPTDGTSDALAAIQACLDGGKPTYLPPAAAGGAITYMLSAPLTIYPGTRLYGPGAGLVTLKLTANACSDVLVGQNAYTLFGSNTNAGIHDYLLQGLVLDGNKANQSGCADPNTVNGIAQYGYHFLWRDLTIQNVLGNGVRTEAYASAGGASIGAATIDGLLVDVTGRHGIWDKGPHDSKWTDVTVIDASQEADNTYDGVYVDNYGVGNWMHFHGWHSSGVANRVAYQMSSMGGSRWTQSDFEGGRRQVQERGAAGYQGDTFANDRFYAPYGLAGDAQVELAGNGNTIVGGQITCAGGAGNVPYAVQLGVSGTAASNTTIVGVSYIGCAATPIDAVNDGGGDRISGPLLTISQMPDGGSAGGNARGADATDLQTIRYAATQVASGQYATIAGGYANIASGAYGAVAGGNQNTASGQFSAIPGGTRAYDRSENSWAYASGLVGSTSGDAQIRDIVLRCSSATASACTLTSNGSAPAGANCVAMANNFAYAVRITLMAFDATTVTKNWAANWGGGTTVHILSRGANAASTLFDGGTGTVAPDTTRGNGTLTGIAATAAADTTNGCLRLSFTPPTGNSDTWNAVARVETTEAGQ
jgi:Pectate lyase superfamily protein